ncbi:MAG: hypothetical protein C0448_10195 [Sphingobacteriaceae bacterium]|nr:hypothetical protein [Sphingobacteriaceae bacterium]
MILIYTHHITPRVSYAMDVVFKTVLNISFQLTDNKEEFKNNKSTKIAYTKLNENFEVFIQSDNLLFESDIKTKIIDAEKEYVDFPKFFKSSTHDFLGYDIFAMVFYFATRYEEYLSLELDEHQRFKAENSISFKYNSLHIPFLNNAIQQFGDKLKNQFSSLKFHQRAFNFVSTIDIDNAFAFANKGLKRNIGGLVKDVFSLKINQVVHRIVSNLNEEKDPYNTFDVINSLSKETQTALQYFVLIGDYSAYDKNPHYKNEGFRKLLKGLSNQYEMGLHPSYESFNHPEKIEIEKKRLEEIIEKKVTSARCHFLKVKFPETYRTFIKVGITDDYTMIYASQSGFRTGLCTPYPWFDLEKNEITSLTIHPSTIMEGTLRDYNGYTVEHANATINGLLNEVKKQGGEFVSVWHNDSFVPAQKEWIDVYKQLLEKSKISN